MKKPKKTIRNPYSVSAKKRKGGVMKCKNEARQNGKNEQQELLKEKEDAEKVSD